MEFIAYSPFHFPIVSPCLSAESSALLLLRPSIPMTATEATHVALPVKMDAYVSHMLFLSLILSVLFTGTFPFLVPISISFYISVCIFMSVFTFLSVSISVQWNVSVQNPYYFIIFIVVQLNVSVQLSVYFSVTIVLSVQVVCTETCFCAVFETVSFTYQFASLVIEKQDTCSSQCPFPCLCYERCEKAGLHVFENSGYDSMEQRMDCVEMKGQRCCGELRVLQSLCSVRIGRTSRRRRFHYLCAWWERIGDIDRDTRKVPEEREQERA